MSRSLCQPASRHCCTVICVLSTLWGVVSSVFHTLASLKLSGGVKSSIFSPSAVGTLYHFEAERNSFI
jgi:hypothetical protein